MKHGSTALSPTRGLIAGGALLANLLLLIAVPSPDQVATGIVFLALMLLARLIALDASKRDEDAFSPPIVVLLAGALILPPLLFALLVFLPAIAGWFGLPSRRTGASSQDSAVEVIAHLVSGLTAGWLYGLMGAGSLPALAVSAGSFLVIYRACITSPRLRRWADTQGTEELRTRSWKAELFVLALGSGVTALWSVNAWLVVPALLQLFLIYRVAQIPRLERQAQTDEKTGLWNARHLNALFGAEIERARRFQRPLAVVMADLDLMRDINNTYGHLAGDGVLRGIGQIIRQSLREYDIAARFGGEEFVLVLPETDGAEAAAIAERLRNAIAQAAFYAPAGDLHIRVTMSFGVASFPGDGLTAGELLRAADTAVYAAKARGRNCVVPTTEIAPAAVQGHERMEFQPSPEHARWETGALLEGLLTVWSARVSSRTWSSAALALTILLLACGLASGGVAAVAAGRALPGDGLYPVKTAIENAQLALMRDPADRLLMQIDLARTRAEEIASLADVGRFGEIAPTARAMSAAMQQADALLKQLWASNPALAARLEPRMTAVWGQAIALVGALRDRVPPGAQTALVEALSHASGQLALLGTPATRPLPTRTPAPGSVQPVPAPLPIPSPAPLPGTAPIAMSTPTPPGTELAVAATRVTTRLAMRVEAERPASAAPMERERGAGRMPSATPELRDTSGDLSVMRFVPRPSPIRTLPGPGFTITTPWPARMDKDATPSPCIASLQPCVPPTHTPEPTIGPEPPTPKPPPQVTPKPNKDKQDDKDKQDKDKENKDKKVKDRDKKDKK